MPSLQSRLFRLLFKHYVAPKFNRAGSSIPEWRKVTDSFGNHTRIQFSEIKRNQVIDRGLFKLELPPDTDIIGDSP